MSEHFKTRMYRATIAQEARVIVGPVKSWRQIQIAVPTSAGIIFLAPDVEPSLIASGTGKMARPEAPKRSPDGLTLDMSRQAIGWDRNYKMPQFTSGVGTLEFPLAPGQWLTGQSQTGVVQLSIVDHPTDPPAGWSR